MRLIGSLHCCLQLSPRLVAPPLYPQTLPLSAAAVGPLFAAPKSMSTAAADTRREQAAQAAERRLQAAMATSTAPKAASLSCCKTKVEDDTCKTRHADSRKRSAAGQQVCFTDSDSDEVTCVGVCASANSTQERGGAGRAAPASKRRRPEEVGWEMDY